MIRPYDTEFSHAVRRAATGIRPQAGVDVAIEGAPLRAILCSEQSLNPAGLELLALAVTGQLRKARKQPIGETMFTHAVRRASAAWRGGKGKSPAVTGDALAIMLRSGQPALGAGERELLAELFAPIPPTVHNELQGRPGKGVGHPDVVAVMEMLRDEIAKGSAHKNAIVDTAKAFQITARTVQEYEAMTREREVALKPTD
ncbi:hypothetical protein EOK75_14290 (plasmid) [Pseudorhodobacter turbinis]|uniref:Uncharacterized protein n=1 Tax=Pseudorhodobacter turbinis TaxID=2500533 RepID=A0A4P8EJS6_9RHOB|nr:hypothetical protein [Pseudorhodobacter turbinis]QCO56965.1 hypothetical protein EOK75_14290 [Pseudorhodobacter turbinis]